MSRFSSNQASFFDADHYFKGVLPGNDWSYTYRDRILPSINERVFSSLYDEPEDLPKTPFPILASLLVFMGFEKFTWPEAVSQLRRRLDWQCATNTTFIEQPVDPKELLSFCLLVQIDDAAAGEFSRIMHGFVEIRGYAQEPSEEVASGISEWLYMLSRYGFFERTIANSLRAPAVNESDLYDNIKKRLSRNYVDGEHEPASKEPEYIKGQIRLMARDAYRLAIAFREHKRLRHHKAFRTLTGLLDHFCVVNEQKGRDPGIVVKGIG